MRHINSFIGFLRYGFMAAAGVLLSSCIFDHQLNIPEEITEAPADAITLEFTMLTRNAASANASRSEMPEPPNPETGFAAENYLDLGHLTFLLFDDTQKMIRTFSPEISAVDDPTAPYVKYRVRTFLHDKYFLHNTADNITFTIVTLGNYSGLSPEHIAYHAGEDLTDIFDRSTVGTFAIPESNNASGSWIPTIAAEADQLTGFIPMSGMQTFTVSTAALRNSTPDKPYQLSGGDSPKYVNMLRALAKIEIIDKIPLSHPGSDNFSIEKVELVGHASRGAILPTFDQWSTGLETDYVTKPSIPSSSTYRGVNPVNGVQTSDADNDAIRTFFYDPDATAARTDGARVFSCYLTEYDPDFIATVPAMWMRVTMKGQQSGKIAQFRLEAAPYTDGVPGSTMPILRNNIYRYVIGGANDIRLDVQPFANLELNFGFGLIRDARGDLMVLPDKEGNYPEYFINFTRDHGFPKALDNEGNPTDEEISLLPGDYYAIVTGENEEMTEATIWVKDREGCHVLSNFGPEDNTLTCSARLVESFYNLNDSERFYKDKFGFRRVHHFDNHNSVARHPVDDTLLFCLIENFEQPDERRLYYEVESWDEDSVTGWIVTKDDAGNETGFRKINPDGTLGETIPLN